MLDFVMAYCGTDLNGAEQILNDQFGLNLPIGRSATRTERNELSRRARQRGTEREQKERSHKRLLEAYGAALSKWVDMDKVIRDKAPQSPFDPINEVWVYAVTHIDEASYNLDLADIALQDFEKRG